MATISLPEHERELLQYMRLLSLQKDERLGTLVARALWQVYKPEIELLKESSFFKVSFRENGTSSDEANK